MTDHGLFDIHCHLIPGVDDGAQDLEETRRLLRMEYEQGVRNIIATPHYRDQMFDTPIRTIRSQFALVEKCVHQSCKISEVYISVRTGNTVFKNLRM